MPTLTPEYKFNKRVKLEVKDSGGNISEVIRGGANWYEEMRTTQPGDNDCLVSVGPTVLSITGDELSLLNPTDHYDAEHGIKKKLFSFGAGVDFCVSVFVKTETLGQTTLSSVCAAGCICYNNTYTYNIGGLAEAGGISWGQTFKYNPINYVWDHGIKFILQTNYTYGLGKAILNETRAAYFDVIALIPGLDRAEAGCQVWEHISSEGLFFTSHMVEFPSEMDNWIYNPQYYWYGYTANQVTTSMPILRTDNLNNFYTALKAINPYLENPFGVEDPQDPSQEDEEPSSPGGGGGNMDKGSDPVDFPGLPSGGPLATGAIRAFEVDTNAITGMFQKLWNSSMFDISTFQKLVTEPLDALITLQCIPIDPHNNGSTPFIQLGNYDTGVAAPEIDQQYYTIDCGSLKVAEYWGSALDYSPYTKVQIFLPFLGIRDLDVDDVMGKTISVKYNYDILTGNFTAQIKSGASVLYKFPGNVKQEVPVTSQVNTRLEALAHGMANVTGAALTGSKAAVVGGIISAAVNVVMAKTIVKRSGDLNGSTGLLDDFNCYLIISRPIQSLAAGFKTQKGYPSNISAVLNTCSGYTEVEYIHLTGITGATDTELNDIERLLKEGVII